MIHQAGKLRSKGDNRTWPNKPGLKSGKCGLTLDKRGLTLVELLAVMLILALVMTAILTTFQFTVHSFSASNHRADAQLAARQATDEIRKALHLATGVTLAQSRPGTLPSAAGYCYAASGPDRIILRLDDSASTVVTIAGNLSWNANVTVGFAPVLIATNGYSPNTIRLTVQIDNYQMQTDIYMQNFASFAGNIKFASGYSPGTYSSPNPPAGYITFNWPD